MKTLKLLSVFTLLALAVACKKQEKHITVSGGLSNDEAADMIASSISLGTNGVIGQANDVAVNAQIILALNASCGLTHTDSVSRQSAPNALTTYNYKASFSYSVICNNDHPDSVSSSYSFAGSFDAKKLQSANQGTATLNIGGLLPTAPAIVFDGTFDEKGTFQSKTNSAHSGSEVVHIVLNSLLVQKHTHLILGGSATISISGNMPSKGDFSFDATLVFNNDGTGTLTFNGGAVYYIDLLTGAVIKK